MNALALDGGFAEPVLGAQNAFRALKDALANPGQPQALGHDLEHAPGITAELAAVALTMCDHDTEVWFDPVLAASEGIVAWLRFQTGAPITDYPSVAAFALVASPDRLPPLDSFALGIDEYPDRSTTIVLPVPRLTGGPSLTLRGPGIKHTQTIAPAGLPESFVVQWADNRALFPRGVDLLLVAGGQVIGLPRTTRISMEG